MASPTTRSMLVLACLILLMLLEGAFPAVKLAYVCFTMEFADEVGGDTRLGCD